MDGQLRACFCDRFALNCFVQPLRSLPTSRGKAVKMSEVPAFDIFAGTPGHANVLWICSVNGLTRAKERMDRIAAQKPGEYFIFFTDGHTVVAHVETSIKTTAA